MLSYCQEQASEGFCSLYLHQKRLVNLTIQVMVFCIQIFKEFSFPFLKDFCKGAVSNLLKTQETENPTKECVVMLELYQVVTLQ